MEFPRHHHHTHHRRQEVGEEHPPPAAPPPPYAPPPPHVNPGHVHHTSHERIGGEVYPPPPPPHPHRPPTMSDRYDAPPPPPFSSHRDYNYSDSLAFPPPARPHDSTASVHHVSHESHSDHHLHLPHMPSFGGQHHSHEHSSGFSGKPTVRVFTKAEADYSLTIRGGKVILARSDTADPFQHWMKDLKYSTKIKDEEGFPSFALINKATGQAMKHSAGATHPVQLIPYNPDIFDESILWTESKDLGDGFRTIRMVNNIRLNVDAFHGDKNHGGVRDGTIIVLWEWLKGDNQRWKILPY